MGMIEDAVSAIEATNVRHIALQTISLGLGLKVHERAETNEVEVLTKGDNNLRDGRGLYAHGQMWLQRHHIMGRSVGFLPYLGWVTIIMTEKPYIKYLLMGALGLLVITSE